MTDKPYIVSSDLTLIEHVTHDLIQQGVSLSGDRYNRYDAMHLANWTTLTYPNGETFAIRLGTAHATLGAQPGQRQAFVQIKSDDTNTAFAENELWRWISHTGGRLSNPKTLTDEWTFGHDAIDHGTDRSSNEHTQALLSIIDRILDTTD